MSLQWKYFQITKTVMVKLFISLSTFALLTADPLMHLPVLVTSMPFVYSLPILPPLLLLTSLPANHTSLISFLSLPHPPSPLFLPLLSPFITTSTFLSLFHSVSSSILIPFNPSFPFLLLLRPFPVFPLWLGPVRSDPIVMGFSHSLSLSLSLPLSGVALQGPADWIRAFYSLWVDHRAQMQIATSVERVP